jgi:hypothetical protein
MEAYLDTRTRQTDDYCQGACGYSAHQKLHYKSSAGLDYWVETKWLPMSKDVRVARPDGQHKWNNSEFLSDRPVETVLVLVYLNTDPLTGSYTMITDAAGNKSAPSVEWELEQLELSAWDLRQLRVLPDEGTDWHSIDYSLTLGENGGKQFRLVSRAPLWQKNPLFVQDVEAYRLAPDFRPAVLVPEKGRAIRFAILKPQIVDEIEDEF